MVDLNKLRNKWREDFTDTEVAKELGISKVSLSRKVNGSRTSELSATQLCIICSMIGSPMSMFVTKEKPHDTHN